MLPLSWTHFSPNGSSWNSWYGSLPHTYTKDDVTTSVQWHYWTHLWQRPWIGTTQHFVDTPQILVNMTWTSIWHSQTINPISHHGMRNGSKAIKMNPPTMLIWVWMPTWILMSTLWPTNYIQSHPASFHHLPLPRSTTVTPQLHGMRDNSLNITMVPTNYDNTFSANTNYGRRTLLIPLHGSPSNPHWTNYKNTRKYASLNLRIDGLPQQHVGMIGINRWTNAAQIATDPTDSPRHMMRLKTTSSDANMINYMPQDTLPWQNSS